MKLEISLNGTDVNPWHKLGLTQNPFPQIPRAQYTRHCLNLQKLGADPIPDTDYIRAILHGWSDEFVNLVCERFKHGEYTRFTVEFPD